MWKWTRARLAFILRTDARHIPGDWPLRPHFHTWPPQGHRAILWILTHFFYFRTQHHKKLTQQDYADYLRGGRWKAHHMPQPQKRVGNYLNVL